MKFAVACLIANTAAIRITTCPNNSTGGWTDSGSGHDQSQNAAGCWVANLSKTCPNNSTGGWAESGDGHNQSQNAAGCWVANLAATCPNNSTGGWAESGEGHTHQCTGGCYKASASDC